MLYAVVVGNIGMSRGKVASQCGHAFTQVLLKSQAHFNDRFTEYTRDGLGTKVCLECDSTDKLLLIRDRCNDLNIPNELIVDSGCKNFFDGQPTITALGIGPTKKSEVKAILGKLKLL